MWQQKVHLNSDPKMFSLFSLQVNAVSSQSWKVTVSLIFIHQYPTTYSKLLSQLKNIYYCFKEIQKDKHMALK